MTARLTPIQLQVLIACSYLAEPLTPYMKESESLREAVQRLYAEDLIAPLDSSNEVQEPDYERTTPKGKLAAHTWRTAAFGTTSKGQAVVERLLNVRMPTRVIRWEFDE